MNRELHYVVKYNLESKSWEIDWDSMEVRFTEGNYYDGNSGWFTLPPELEDTVIQELNQKLSNTNAVNA